MSKHVTIVDYGMGNLFSVQRAFEHCGAEVKLSSDPAEIASADRLVLPGVGAFADGMAGLRERGLIEPIREYAAKERPFLGICLGMQMMMDIGEEFGHHEGLGLIGGKVVQISTTTTAGEPLKIPLIGWNALEVPQSRDSWEHTILQGTAPHSYLYFVHSYAAVPTQPEHLLAITRYGGHDITAAISSGYVYGCQFHPERSGETGLRIVEAFLSL